MSQLNADLESHLDIERGLNSTRGDQTQLLEPLPEDSRQELIENTRNSAEYSLVFNLLAIFVPAPKILASLVVVLSGNYPCMGAKQIWLICMIFHDALHLHIIRLRIKNLLAFALLTPNNTGSARNNNNAHSTQEIQLSERNLNEVAPQQPEDNSREYLEREREQAQRGDDNAQKLSEIMQERIKIQKLKATCTYFWMFLFLFWLELDSVRENGPCDTEQINSLISVYIVIGWIWLLNPLLFCLAGCLCLPVLLIIICIFGKKNQVPATKNEIKNLPKKKYDASLPGNKECAICIVDYQPGDSIVQLECSEMHHFHEQCLKSWLEINGQCPICRARIGTKRDAPSH